MLDMGFVHDVRRVVAALPAARQTLFFSATIAPHIETLARTMLANPARVSIAPTVTTAERVDQSVVFVDKADKRAMLERVLREAGAGRRSRPRRWSSRAPSTAPTASPSSSIARASAARPSTATRRRAPASARSRPSAAGPPGSSSRPTSPPAGSTSRASRSSSTSTSRTWPRATSTASAAPAAPAPAGRAISFCDREERPLLVDIERLIRRRLPGDRQRPAAARPPGGRAAAGPSDRRPSRHSGDGAQRQGRARFR